MKRKINLSPAEITLVQDEAFERGILAVLTPVLIIGIILSCIGYLWTILFTLFFTIIHRFFIWRKARRLVKQIAKDKKKK